MLITIVILVAAVGAAIAYFAARLFPAEVDPQAHTWPREEGEHREEAGARPDVAPRTAAYVRRMATKEES